MKTKEAASFKVRPNALLSKDPKAMYAEFLASEAEPDREDEIIFPMAYNTAYWQQNPVWLWAHDKSKLPIGAGYKPDGAVACYQTEKSLILGNRFSQANPEGPIIYALYDEGTLKMVSVGFINTRTEQMAGTPWGLNRPVTVIQDPELVECSCVPIGMLRSAMLLAIKGKSWDGYVDRVGLASVLDNGHLHGEKVPEGMARDLAPFAAAKTFKSSAWGVKAVSPNKIPKFSSRVSAKTLALHQPFGSSFMASIAKAPLKAGAIPTKDEIKIEPVVETKAAAAVETKADETPASPKPEGETMVMSVGGQIFKAAMDALAGACKGIMEMVPQSDSEDVKSYWSKTCGGMAKMVGEMYDNGVKMFPDYASEFEESATIAAEFAALGDEPDAAMNNTDEEAALMDESKAEGDEEPTEQSAEEDSGDAKSVGELVTVKAFNEWAAKSFGEATPLERFEAMMAERDAKIEALVSQVGELREGLEAAETILTGAR